jgi:predicted phage-related endonuclease
VKEVDLMLLIWPNFKLFNYQRNKNLENNLIELEHDFWHNHVLKQEPPEPKVYEDVVKLFPNGSNELITATDEIESMIYQYDSLRGTIKMQESALMEIKKNICAYMKEKSILVNNFGKELGTWKEQTTKRIDIALLKATMQPIYSKFLKETKTRVFRLKGLNDE